MCALVLFRSAPCPSCMQPRQAVCRICCRRQLVSTCTSCSADLLQSLQVNGWHQHGWHQAPQPRPPPHWQHNPRGRGRGRGRGRYADSHPGNVGQHPNGHAAAPSAAQLQAAAAAEAAERETAAQAAAEAKMRQSEAQIAALKQRIAEQQAEKAARQVGSRSHCAALHYCF